MSAVSLCRELLVVAHLFTVHVNQAADDRTYGAGLECRQDDVSAAIGAFRNSFERTSVYAAVGVDLLDLGDHLHLGVLGGVASGYEDQHDWPLIAGARARFSFGRVEVGAIGLPPVAGAEGGVHFTLAWRLP